MDPDHVDMVRHGKDGDVVIFMSPETAGSLAILLHLVDDSPTAHLSLRLRPLMRVLDRKLIGYKGQRAGSMR